MTPADLLPIIRRDYLDEDLAVIGNPELVARWPREFILREIGAAQRQACLRQDLRHIYDDGTEDLCQITLDPGQEAYDLDPRVLRIKWANVVGSTLAHVTRKWMDWNSPHWRDAANATPMAFWIEGRRLHLWPAPAAAGTLLLAVWRLPLLIEPNWNDDLEWPGEQDKLAHWVAYRAFLRPNPDTVNVDLAKTHLALFEQEFGPAVPERVRAEILTGPDDVFIRPGAARRLRQEW